VRLAVRFARPWDGAATAQVATVGTMPRLTPGDLARFRAALCAGGRLAASGADPNGFSAADLKSRSG
jgi:hypothetical protein